MAESENRTMDVYQEAAIRRAEIQSSEEIRKREFGVRPVRSGHALFEIFVEGGGAIPESLKSRYTSPQKASRAIQVYLRSLEVKKETKRPYHRSRINVAKNKTRD